MIECIEFKASNDPSKPFLKGVACVIDKRESRKYSHIRFYVKPDGQKWVGLMSGRYTEENGEEKFSECTEFLDWKRNKAWKLEVIEAITKKIEEETKQPLQVPEFPKKDVQGFLIDDDLPF